MQKALGFGKIYFMVGCFVPEIFPLHICLLEHPVIRVDHSGPENAEQDDNNGELVERPQCVASHI